MEIEIVTKDKNNIEIKMDNLTISEVLRVYLNEQGIEFAAWRKEHPTKPLIFKIESKGKMVNKAVSDAVNLINKDLDKILNLVNK